MSDAGVHKKKQVSILFDSFQCKQMSRKMYFEFVALELNSSCTAALLNICRPHKHCANFAELLSIICIDSD